MRVADSDYILALHNGARVVNYATFTLYDGTVLNLQPADFRVSGNNYTDKTTDGNSFSVGSFIGKTANICIDNSTGKFDGYDFYMSRFILKESVAVGSNIVKHVSIGNFTVVTDVTPGSIISFSAVDDTYLFDKVHNLSGTKTLKEIIQQACTQCLGSPTLDGTGNFALYNTQIDTNKLDAKLTWRQIVGYVAIMTGNNAYIDVNEILKFKWYDFSVFDDGLDGGTFDTNTTPYSDGDTAGGGDFTFSESTNYDGGTFTDTQDYHIIQSYKGFNIGTYDISITGVRVVNGDTVVEKPSSTQYNYSYVIEVKDNPLCVGIENTVATHLASKLNDLTFRIFSCGVLCNPLIEAGDMALVIDTKGIAHRTIINDVSFTTGGFTQVSCKAENIIRQQSSYTSEAAKAVVEANRNTERQLSIYDESVQRMNRLAQNSSGLYTAHVVQDDGSAIYYESDHIITYDTDGNAIFTPHSFVCKDAGSGYFYSTDAGTDDESTTWTGGIDRAGNAVLNTLALYKLTADWIIAGILTDRYGLNYWNLDTGEFRLAPNVAAGSSVYGRNYALTTYIFTRVVDAVVVEGVGQWGVSPRFINDFKSYNAIRIGFKIKRTGVRTQQGEGYIGFYINITGKINGTTVTQSLGRKLVDAVTEDDTTFKTAHLTIEPYNTFDEGSITAFNFFKIDQFVASGTMEIKEVKVELSNDYTAWTSAPEDEIGVFTAFDESFDQDKVFGRLTNGDLAQGIVLSNGKLYINASYINAGEINANLIKAGVIADKAGIFSLNMVDGSLVMNSGTFRGLVAAATVQGSTIQGGSININNQFAVDGSGNMTAKSGTIGNLTLGNGALYAYGTVNFASNRNITASKRTRIQMVVAKFTPSRIGVASNFQIVFKYYVVNSYSRDMYVRLQYGSGSSWTDVESYYLSYSQYSETTINFSTTISYTSTTRYRVIIDFMATSSSSYRQRIICNVLTGTVVKTAFSADGFVGKINSHSGDIGGVHIESGIISTNNSETLYEENDGVYISGDELSMYDVGTPLLLFTQYANSYTGYIGLLVNGNLTAYQDTNNYVVIEDDGYVTYMKNGTSHSSIPWSGSDRRIKEDITVLDMEMSKALIDATDVYKFKYKNDEGHHYGVMAQDVREVLDSLGEYDSQLEYEMEDTEVPGSINVAYQEYIPLLINYVKDLRAEINELKEEIKSLKEEK